MIGTIIFLGILAAGTDAPRELGEEPVLSVDPCVEVDQTTVLEVMDLELRDARARNLTLPSSVRVRCVGETQEIRLGSGPSREDDEVRTIHLAPVADAAAPAARQARSRELALAIAELIRRREITAPALPVTPTPLPPQPAVPALVAPPAQSTEVGRWQLGILSTYEHFAGGQEFIGGDLFVTSRLGHRLLAELGAGVRAGEGQTLPDGRLSVRAATVGAAVGVLLWPETRPVGLAMMVRAQEYLVQFRAEGSGEGGMRTALLGAFVLAAEPRLFVAVARHFALEATAAVGFPVRGIAVRTRGAETRSVSGLLLSGSLAGVLTL